MQQAHKYLVASLITHIAFYPPGFETWAVSHGSDRYRNKKKFVNLHQAVHLNISGIKIRVSSMVEILIIEKS